MDEKVNLLIKENETVKKELAALRRKMFVLKAKELMEECQEANGLRIIVDQLDGADANALKDIAATVKGQWDNAVIFLASVSEDKAVFVAGAGSAAVQSGIKCGELVKEAALLCGGKGGGRPDLAQSGAKDTTKITDVIAMIKNKLGLVL